MDDDFNTSLALAEIFELVSCVNTAIADKELNTQTAKTVQLVRDTVIELLSVFGIDMNKKQEGNLDVLAQVADSLGIQYSPEDDIAKIILEARASARANKDWAMADGIRDAVAQAGLTIQDTPQGSRII